MVADEMILHPEKNPEDIVKGNIDYQPLNNEDVINDIVEQVLRENPQSIEDYKKGKTKAFAFLVGQVMKHTKGKADPSIVNDLLKKKLEK